jgi:hypothetical protein
MDNQHRKIDGYRELDLQEIGLINAIKEKGRELIELQQRVYELPVCGDDELGTMEGQREMWAKQSHINIETGVMQLVRAVAQPE